VKVDVHVLDMNGCLQEAAALAVLGGILTFRRPNAFVDPDTDELVVQSMEESTPVKLHLFHLPMLTSFAICEGKLLAEPSYEEEEVSYYSGYL
jgi:exosome complex RNA-binding protein Rrp42 (RNase PH superfamily)